MFASRLDVYGRKIVVEAFDSRIKSDLDHDFAYFVAPSLQEEGGAFRLKVLPAKKRPRFWIALLVTKRSTLYASRSNVRRVCFFGSAWLEYSVKEKKCSIYCDDPAKAYEAVYFVLLSYLGEQLGESGLHRIHGMGFTYKGQGVILLAPSGGGKSTLAMELLRSEAFRILSDDTPIVNREGKMFAFPQRIALSEKPNIESTFLRKFKRFNHSEKFVVGADFFSQKISASSQVQWLILLENSKRESGIEEVSRIHFIWPLLKWLVIGFETPQIWELVLRSSRTDIKIHAKALLGRLRTAAILLATTRVATLHRSEDPKVTTDFLQSFLNRQTADAENEPTRN